MNKAFDPDLAPWTESFVSLIFGQSDYSVIIYIFIFIILASSSAS